MKLAAFRYHIVHITGEENVWANLLSRWGATAFSRSYPKIISLLLAPVSLALDPDFKCGKNPASQLLHCKAS